MLIHSHGCACSDAELREQQKVLELLEEDLKLLREFEQRFAVTIDGREFVAACALHLRRLHLLPAASYHSLDIVALTPNGSPEGAHAITGCDLGAPL